MSDEIINGLLYSKEEMEELGLVDENDEIEAKAEKEAEGLVESNIVGE